MRALASHQFSPRSILRLGVIIIIIIIIIIKIIIIIIIIIRIFTQNNPFSTLYCYQWGPAYQGFIFARSRIVSGRSNVYDELLFQVTISPKCYEFISQESLLRAYSTLKCFTIKVKYNGEMKISLIKLNPDVCFDARIVSNDSSCMSPGFHTKVPQCTATR